MPSKRPTTDADIVLSLADVSKRYGAVQALSHVNLECYAGEIHAVVGENGSGKSTLLGIASGFVEQDEGEVRIGGKRLRTDSPGQARALGLGMAYQEVSIVTGLAVKENLYLATPKNQRPTYLKMKDWAIDILARYELDELFADAPTGWLSVGERQMLEVVKALLADPEVLLLDEPTTALGPTQVDWLHRTILECVAQGKGIVYVSHRLPEVLSVANRVTVLRDGKSQGTYEAAGMSEAALVELMMGRPFDAAFPRRSERADKSEVLTVIDLEGEFCGPLTFSLRRGEILGIAGVEGNGQGDLFATLSGRIPPERGMVLCQGEHVDLTSPVAALRSGVMLLPSDRKNESLFGVLGVCSNATIQVLKRFSRAGWVSRQQERSVVARLVEHLKIRTPSLEQPVQFLSGGNQQKVVLTRTHLRESIKVILADEPTQGVDVGSRFDIYDALHAKAIEGTAIIVKSSDPIELAGFCNRVFVMSRGQFVDEILQSELSERRIIEAMVGGVSGLILPEPSMSIAEQAEANVKEMP